MFHICVLIVCAVIFGIIDFLYLENIKCGNSELKKWKFKFKVYGKERIKYICIFVILIAMSLVLSLKFEHPFANDFRLVALISVLLVAAITDLKSRIIPNKLLLMGSGYWVIWVGICFLSNNEHFFNEMISSVAALVAITIICVICLFILKNAIGMGDLKLMMLMAMLQGALGLCSSLFLSFVFAFVACIFFLITKKKGKKDYIAFAPFAFLGTIVSIILKGV